jgi:HSP20 family molecular chaperone IbpA
MNDPTERKSALLLQMFASLRHDHPLTMIQQENLFDLLGRSTPEALMRSAEAVPRVDVDDTGDALEVTAELPGLAPSDIDVVIEEGMLVLRGEKRRHGPEGQAARYLSERHFGPFQRSFPLPAWVDVAGIAASFERGVLRITLPRLPDVMGTARSIPVLPN